MRALAALALLLTGCSFDWEGVQPYYLRDASSDGVATPDPRHTILPGFSCNPVSGDGCPGSACQADIRMNQTFAVLSCFSPHGSENRGVPCADHSFCVPGLLCWTDPNDASVRTCELPCFSSADCGAGACDTTGGHAVRYGSATLFRCF